MAENYKNAFKCSECPKSNGENGCPAWNELIMTESNTGEQKIVRGCNFQLLPWIMTEAIKASNVATGTAADMKNEVAKGFAVMASALPGLLSSVASSVEEKEEDSVQVLLPEDKS